MMNAESAVPMRRSRSWRGGRAGKAAPAEDPEAQERGLEEEREQALDGQRRAEDVAHEPAVGAPVHAELELLDDARDHAQGEVDDEQLAEEAGEPQTASLPVRYQAVWRPATVNASPMVSGTNRKW